MSNVTVSMTNAEAIAVHSILSAQPYPRSLYAESVRQEIWEGIKHLFPHPLDDTDAEPMEGGSDE